MRSGISAPQGNDQSCANSKEKLNLGMLLVMEPDFHVPYSERSQHTELEGNASTHTFVLVGSAGERGSDASAEDGVAGECNCNADLDSIVFGRED